MPQFGPIAVEYVVPAGQAQCLGKAALVVLDPMDTLRSPKGMLTDRDVIRGQISLGADLHCLTVIDRRMHQKPDTTHLLRTNPHYGDQPLRVMLNNAPRQPRF